MFSFHLVEKSIWPIFLSMSMISIVTGLVGFVRGWSIMLMMISVLSLVMIFIVWWRDVIRESSMQGFHPISIEVGLKIGFLLFILSEVLFFFSFFWSFFQFSLVPISELGEVWPPVGILGLDFMGVPLLNTLILLSSGFMVTLSHHMMLRGIRFMMILGLLLGIMLGVTFTYFQAEEYMVSSFTMGDSVFGTSFFVMTGFHGLHVLVGTTFLLVVFMRLLYWQFSVDHHVGFELAAWYWHFVDVVWIFLFMFVYIWSLF